ncbi:sulfurtransferase complex subunit TusB [Ferrimonas gelatinilytica]|uniref:Sulfurtransferase complex subunit TusB n=1 Tax=Ferrimonas gelatinilytica TaxID=1255257 RepID=A0ABP9RWU6_9GAMM
MTTTLTTLTAACATPAQLAHHLRHLPPGAPLLLLQDAVVMATQPRFETILARFDAYLLLPDVEARGLVSRIQKGLKTVDYYGFVELTLQTQNQIAW